MHRIGLLGYGYWGPIMMNCFSSIENPFCVVADRHHEKALSLKEKCVDAVFVTSIDDVIKDSTIEGVVVALPTSMHYEICKKALLAGKHVLVEKPFTNCSKQAKELSLLAKALGLVLMVDHHFIYKRSICRLKELYDYGSFGKLHYFESSRANLGIFRRDDDVVWDLLPHDLSILKYIIGYDPVAVSAVGSSHVVPGKVDFAQINLFYENDFIAHVFLSWLIPNKLRTIYLGGSRLVALYDDNEPTDKLKLCEVDYQKTMDSKIICCKDNWNKEADTDNAIANVAREFIDCIETGNSPLSDGWFATDVIKVIETVSKSISLNGQIVNVL